VEPDVAEQMRLQAFQPGALGGDPQDLPGQYKFEAVLR